MRAGTLTQTGRGGQPPHRSVDLERLFADCFGRQYRTWLRGGAAEPFYRAGGAGDPVIWYTGDYFRSALHEVAHWCVAGPARRRLDDYGYWYAPDGRDAGLQRQFEAVEVLPQAWELLFCSACLHPFRVSADNLAPVPADLGRFEAAVLQRAVLLAGAKPRGRAWSWVTALGRDYRGRPEFDAGWIREAFLSWS